MDRNIQNKIKCIKCGRAIRPDSEFCRYCGTKRNAPLVPFSDISASIPPNKSKNPLKYVRRVIYIIAIIVFISLAVYWSTEDEGVVETGKVAITSNSDITATIVNIWCPVDDELAEFEGDGYGGSGTILTADGIIITNSHIIPQDDEFLNTPEYGCFVTLPEPATGFPDEIYLADPIVVPGLSDEYDLAVMEIYDVYIDEDGYEYGTWPKTFQGFDDTYCNPSEEYVQLGEPVWIYGYPISSGGENLTITEGVVSSFVGDGTILTSAKIDEGNSGGLAVDKYGCGLGIPSAVSLGEYENLGVIISMDLVNEFIDEYLKLLDEEE